MAIVTQNRGGEGDPSYQLIRIQSVEVLSGFWVRLTFTDGVRRMVDLTPYLRGPVFEQIRNDPALFRAVSVDPRMKTIVWPNGADIDPDVLYHNLPPAWMEDDVALVNLPQP